MRSESVKASLVLGICLILGAIVIVLGTRWAVGSALHAHLLALERLESSLAAGSDGVQSAVMRGSDQLAGSMEGSQARLSETVIASTGMLKESVDRSFEKPVLIRAPQPLPVAGPLSVQGAEDGPPVDVAATLGEGGDGE